MACLSTSVQLKVKMSAACIDDEREDPENIAGVDDSSGADLKVGQ